MHTIRAGRTVSQSKALELIKKEVGFPNPSPQRLTLYFEKVLDDSYVDVNRNQFRYKLKVDLAQVRKKLDERGLRQSLNRVIENGGRDTEEFSNLVKEIEAVIASCPLSVDA